MRIGIDFDNTIVSYDALFHKVAVEQAAAPPDCARTKLAVRNHLRAIGKEDLWTEMQGYVYGARMSEAEAYPGAIEFFEWASASGIAIFIVSHKTLHPFIGPKYDLHQAARNWIASHLVGPSGVLLPPDRVFFELTKEAKLNRADELQCDWFIDDLPEILCAPKFPERASKILFDPESHHGSLTGVTRMADWSSIQRHFEQACKSRN